MKSEARTHLSLRKRGKDIRGERAIRIHTTIHFYELIWTCALRLDVSYIEETIQGELSDFYLFISQSIYF